MNKSIANITSETLHCYGWTQTTLARHLGVSQATVDRLNRGLTVNPGYALGAKLVELHKARPRTRKAKST